MHAKGYWLIKTPISHILLRLQYMRRLVQYLSQQPYLSVSGNLDSLSSSEPRASELMESPFANIAPRSDEQKLEASDSTKDMVSGAPLIVESSKPETKPTVNSSSIPDGGLIAWTQCAGSFFLFFNGFGMINTFGMFGKVTHPWLRPTSETITGVFQKYYEQTGLPAESPSNISWIGSLQACLLIGVGAFTGPLFDQGYLRSLLFAGTFALVFGMMMTSLCTQYWHFVLAQGLVVGLGCGLHFVPAIAVLPTYFSSKRALTLGIGTSGSSLGVEIRLHDI